MGMGWGGPSSLSYSQFCLDPGFPLLERGFWVLFCLWFGGHTPRSSGITPDSAGGVPVQPVLGRKARLATCGALIPGQLSWHRAFRFSGVSLGTLEGS